MTDTQYATLLKVTGDLATTTASQYATLLNMVSNLTGSVTHLEGSVGNLEGSVADLEGSVGNLEGSVTHLEGSVARLDARLVEHMQESEESHQLILDAIGGHVGALETTTANHETRITKLEHRSPHKPSKFDKFF